MKFSRWIKKEPGFFSPGAKEGYLSEETVSLKLPEHLESLDLPRKPGFRLLRFLRGSSLPKRPNVYSPVIERKRYRKKICVLAGLLLVLAGLWGGGQKIVETWVRETEFFKVTEIMISGQDVVPRELLQSSSGILLHQSSLFDLDPAAVEKRLVSIPWIKRAAVKRDWPSTVRIEVIEYQPIALVHSLKDKKPVLSYVDRDGEAFFPVRPESRIDFPVITGISDVNDPDIYRSAFKEVLILLKRAQRNNPYLPAQSLSEIHVNAKGELTLYLVEYSFPIYFGKGQTEQKFDRLVYVLKDLYRRKNGKEGISEVAFINMDYFQDKVLVSNNGQD
ncbi:MAG: hypothetical protein CSB23_03635 [Deltaproteobacteria bacterium]|nr:MAG: hypothetical protein CSB23_03635 [Deltaproteobacteria bacterium]